MAASSEENEIKLDTFQTGAFDTMNEYRKKNLFCDVSLDTNGTLFPCHRLILTASSTYFQVMFNGNFKESGLKVIPMKEIDAKIMEILLSAIYTTRIRLLPENVYFVLKASHMLQIDVIFYACVHYIMKNVGHIHYLPNTCSFAKTMGPEKLYDECLESTKLTSALADLMVAAESETDCESADDENQSNNHDLNLNLYLDAFDVKSGARGWGSLKMNESFSNYTLSNFQPMDLWYPRICSMGLKTYYFARNLSAESKRCIFSCFEDSSRIDLRVPKEFSTYDSYEMIAVGKVIYFFQGHYNSNIWVYDCELDTWQDNIFQVPLSYNLSKSVLYDYSQWSDVTFLDNAIYVIGCKNHDSGSDERYIISIDTRTPQTRNLIAFPSSFQRENSTVCAFDGKIAISGTSQDSALLNTFSIFDVTAKKWRNDLKPMNESAARHKMIHRNGFIYAVDERPFNKNEKYDVKLNTWTEIPKVPERAQFVNADGVNMTIGFHGLINAEFISL
ncbi:kelch-like protein 7 isoform X2 [Planococcus citri]|uniref:kelch-like protein 7 isoform X2 n=1 Tax=Planococcus citri TaxID=170843 RepID=UPI0031F76347